MGRVFTFGCSFTSYGWITWADILCYGNNGINLGQTGGGFEQISNKLVWAKHKYNITSEDLVVIVYPSLIRWDISNLDKLDDGSHVSTWSCWGQATSSDLVEYQHKLWTEESCIHRSLNNILLIKSFLERYGIPHITSAIMDVFEHTGNYIDTNNKTSNITDHMDYIKKESPLDVIDFKNFLVGDSNEWMRDGIYRFEGNPDYHPTIKEHTKWLDEVLLPKIGLERKISDETIQELDRKVRSGEFNDLSDVSEFFDKQTNLLYQRQDTRLYFDDFDVEYPDPTKGFGFNLR